MMGVGYLESQMGKEHFGPGDYRWIDVNPSNMGHGKGNRQEMSYVASGTADFQNIFG
jgi:hypothetical protein